MSRQKSYLRTTDRARRRRNFRVIKIVGGVSLVVLLFVGLSYISRASVFSIKNIAVSGNITATSPDIEENVNSALAGAYFRIFSKRNIFIYPRAVVRESILKNFTRTKDVKVSFKDFNTISVEISEYAPFAEWCGEKTLLKAASSPSCYFMDDSGYIFASAPTFTGNVYLVYYGKLPQSLSSSSESVIGKSFLPQKIFSNVSIFAGNLKSFGLPPRDITRDENGDYTARLLSGARILFSESEDLATTSENLLTIIGSGKIPLKDQKFLSNLDYLDLRYGNKIFYKLRKDSGPSTSTLPSGQGD